MQPSGSSEHVGDDEAVGEGRRGQRGDEREVRENDRGEDDRGGGHRAERGERGRGDERGERVDADGASDAAVESLSIGFYHPRAGVRTGGGKAVYVRGMLEQLADEHDVVLYTGEGELLDAVRELPIEVRQVPTDHVAGVELPDDFAEVLPSEAARESLLAYANARLCGLCDRMDERLDVLYTQYYVDDVLLSRTVDVPTVYHCHGLDGRGVGERLRAHLSETDACLANTERIAAQLSRRFGVEADGVVAPGVDVERFAPDATPAFDADGPVVLFVGRVERAKGVFDLVEAVDRLAAGGERPDLELHVVGDGPHEAELRERVAELGLEDAVEFAGVVPNDELQHCYAAADVVCNPSHYESLGMVNLEALACGSALVATDLDAVTAYATDDESALLVPPEDVDALADALDRALASQTLRERLGRAGRDAAAEYAWEKQGERLVSHLAAVTGGERVRTGEPARRAADAD